MSEVIVGIGRALPEGDRRVIVGRAEWHLQRRRRVVEESAVAEIVRDLPAEFCARQQRVPDATGRGGRP